MGAGWRCVGDGGALGVGGGGWKEAGPGAGKGKARTANTPIAFPKIVSRLFFHSFFRLSCPVVVVVIIA